MAQKKEGRPLQGTRYVLVRKIGEGTTSEVHEAIGPDGEMCALKILRRLHADSPQATARHLQETHALAALAHPHVVPIDDAGVTADGRPFLAMPLLAGETLRARLDGRGPLPPSTAVRVVRELLSALGAVHRLGIVHRDVKPANVFLARNGGRRVTPGRPRRERWASVGSADVGSAILLDFGIAKLRWGAVAATTGAHVLGTPRYLAPEQILGGAVDARTDIYAVGTLLFEAIAGRGPFTEPDTIALMRAHLRQAPASLRAVAGVPAALDQVVARALAKAPARRWESADAMIAALDVAREGLAITRRPTSLVTLGGAP
ncbi:serine/threonine-protein kinase [Chondromyces crocatus]|uniref:Protein kinase n=1 Tax=Chondromyces crocatus TaxID=52 RepID=A0A0K1EU58_CHOCO|nr:serine/threonine-protein kinase [Chondromyces crocatus]AKT44158.1 protein kinase [Chondromyces crocatus]